MIEKLTALLEEQKQRLQMQEETTAKLTQA
jgi:hypothetical protein